MSTSKTIEVGSVDAQENIDSKMISKTVTSIVDDPVEELSRKANMLNLSETPKHNQTTTPPKFKNNYYQNRKPYNSNNNFSTNRPYQLTYSAYPYPVINSAGILPNSSIQMIPSPYMYASNYANLSNNIYATRHNSHYKMNKERRANNLQKLWPHSLKKQQQKETIHEDEPKSEINKESNESSSEIKSSNNENKIEISNKISEEKIPDNKTPMCMINELVRYNKIKHEYVLLDEIGPAHKKIFYIMLKLGIDSENEESYTAQESSIKKTQHAAAELALKNTKFKLPVKRDKNLVKTASRDSKDDDQTDSKIAQDSESILTNKRSQNNPKTNPPTVRLNTLAMKLGLVANYNHSVSNYANSVNYNLDLTQQQHSIYGSQPFDYNNYTSFMNSEYKPFKYQPTQIYNSGSSCKSENLSQLEQPRHYFTDMRRSHQSYQIAQQIQRPKQIINVKLTFANKEFKGQGITLQLAKHDAASKALEYFSDPEKFLEAKSLANLPQNKTIKAYRPPQFYQQDEKNDTDNQAENDQKEIKENSKNILNSEKKSEIQLVYEYAYYLKKTVNFELVQESGPSHIKKFVTKCQIGNRETDQTDDKTIQVSIESKSFPIETIGEGNSKKESKKNSAINMLVILKEKFEPLLLISSRFVSGENNKLSSEASNQERLSSNLNELNKKHRKNKAKNIIKIKKTNPEYGKGSINPISRLMQIQQAKKEREPVFEFLPQTKRRNQEFIMQVTIEPAIEGKPVLKCEGKGLTKKQAKQKAAEAMLNKLGYQPRQPAQSSLKYSFKPTEEQSPDAIEVATINLDNTENLVEKNEKKVKFLEDPLVKDEKSDTSKPKPVSIGLATNDAKKMLKTTKPQSQSLINHLAKQEKLKKIQENIAYNQSKIKESNDLDQKGLDLVYKIASELLESVKKNGDSTEQSKEFYSPTAEQYLKKNENLSQQSDNDIQEVTNNDEAKIQFKILNGGTDSINYKKILEFLAKTLCFKVSYQSLLGRDGSVYSYVSLSILSETEKPLNGHGITHIESSNAAALCALRYLASKYNQPKQFLPSKTNVRTNADLAKIEGQK